MIWQLVANKKGLGLQTVGFLFAFVFFASTNISTPSYTSPEIGGGKDGACSFELPSPRLTERQKVGKADFNPLLTSPEIGGGKDGARSLKLPSPILTEPQKVQESPLTLTLSRRERGTSNASGRLFAIASILTERQKVQGIHETEYQPPPNLPRSSGEEIEEAVPGLICPPSGPRSHGRVGEIQRGLNLCLGPTAPPILPHKRMLDEPTSYPGYRGDDPKEVEEVRIGFFAPIADSPLGLSMWQGATLAIKEANDRGGYRGKPFRLVHRWAADPWGAGANKVVRLLYDDRVCALIGSIDGDSTHLAEQIVTKARATLVSPIATDPTLNYIRIPWMFRLAPDDERQANRIAEKIDSMKAKRVILLHSTRHDDRIGAEEMVEALLKRQRPPIRKYVFDSPLLEPETIAGRIQSASPDAIILWCGPEDAQKILVHPDSGHIQYPILGPLSLNVPRFRSSVAKMHHDVHLITVREDSTSAASKFKKVFEREYGKPADYAAAYAFDAVGLIVKAVQSVGVNRADIRDAIAASSGYEGVTGGIEWDNGGGNRGSMRLETITKLHR